MLVGWNVGLQGTERKAVYTERADPVCECMGQSTLEESVQGGGVDNGGVKFFNQLLKLTNQKRQKSHVQYAIKINQSKITHGKIASKSKMP